MMNTHPTFKKIKPNIDNIQDRNDNEYVIWQDKLNYLIDNIEQIIKVLISLPAITFQQNFNKQQQQYHQCKQTYLTTYLLLINNDDYNNEDYSQLIQCQNHLIRMINDIKQLVGQLPNLFITNLTQQHPNINTLIQCNQCNRMCQGRYQEIVNKFFFILTITYKIPHNQTFKQWYIPRIGQLSTQTLLLSHISINSQYIYLINYLYPYKQLVNRIQNMCMAINLIANRNQIYKIRIKSMLFSYIHCLFSFHQINDVRHQISKLTESMLNISFKVYFIDSWNHTLQRKIEEIARKCQFLQYIRFKLVIDQNHDQIFLCNNSMTNIDHYRNKIYLGYVIERDLFRILTLPSNINSRELVYTAMNKIDKLAFWLCNRKQLIIKYPSYCNQINNSQTKNMCVYCKNIDADLILDCLHVIHRTCLKKHGLLEQCPGINECGKYVNKSNIMILRNYLETMYLYKSRDYSNAEIEECLTELYQDMSIKIVWKQTNQTLIKQIDQIDQLTHIIKIE